MNVSGVQCSVFSEVIQNTEHWTQNTILSISFLSLHHFRNYHSTQLDLSPQPVVLTGHNGAGKTNILEALSLLTPGRGLRKAKLKEMDYVSSLRIRLRSASEQVLCVSGGASSDNGGEGREGGELWALFASVNGMQGRVNIGTGRESNAPLPASPLRGEENKRIVKIDGKIIRSQAELARHMAMLWLTPQMEQLFHESASSGRKFLDRLVYSFDGDHASRVNEYEFAMRERNKLLADGRADAHWLEALEQTMAEMGAAIAAARLSACEHINAAIQDSPLSFPKAHIGIHGVIEDGLAEGEAAVMVEEAFKKTLQENRRQDQAAGRALAGAHRSEMTVIHVEKQMPAESCSTGEQKALLLSIVLAQARAGQRWHGVVPVLLLDEVAAHLDAVKRLELFEEIHHIKAQVWMTGTDVKLFEGMEGKAQFFRVENGTVIPAQAGIQVRQQE